MNQNRRWVALAYFSFGLLLWVLVSKFVITIMGWMGLEEFDFELVGEQFTLTTMVGFCTALFLTLYCYRHPTLSNLSNEVVVELKKVTWPNSQETRGATLVVIVTVFIMALFLGVFDLIWSNIMDMLYPSVQA
jgi:preprotein translocase SecE subunit